MPFTLRDLADDVLRELAIIRARENAPAKDVAQVEVAYRAMLEEWEVDGLVFWDDEAAIPDRARRPLVLLVATEMAPRYGKAYDRAAAGRARLARLADTPWDGTEPARSYF